MRLLLVDTGHLTESNQQRTRLRYSRCIFPVPGTPGLIKETLYLSNSCVKFEIKNQKMVYHEQNIVLSVFILLGVPKSLQLNAYVFSHFRHGIILFWDGINQSLEESNPLMSRPSRCGHLIYTFTTSEFFTHEILL